MCTQCGNMDHSAKDYQLINTKCRFCQKKGYIEVVCLQKKKGKEFVGYIIED